jgi:hypothetical protein
MDLIFSFGSGRLRRVFSFRPFLDSAGIGQILVP